MKDIHKAPIEKLDNTLTRPLNPTHGLSDDYINILYKVVRRFAGYNVSHNHVWSPSDELNLYTGDFWVKYDEFVSKDGWAEGRSPKWVKVYNKCGIELLFPYSMNFSPDGNGHIKLCEHLKNNLNIDCSENTSYNEMKKLCRTV